MGDRGQVEVREAYKGEGTRSVYFYTHWGGSELEDTLRRGLRKACDAGRLSDTPYLNRIIFCEMVKGDVDGVLSYGISPTPTDFEDDHTYLVNADALTVKCGVQGVWESIVDFIERGEEDERFTLG
jgi:hypothetical protein